MNTVLLKSANKVYKIGKLKAKIFNFLDFPPLILKLHLPLNKKLKPVPIISHFKKHQELPLVFVCLQGTVDESRCFSFVSTKFQQPVKTSQKTFENPNNHDLYLKSISYEACIYPQTLFLSLQAGKAPVKLNSSPTS